MTQSLAPNLERACQYLFVSAQRQRSDRELLEAFVEERSQDAFAALVQRHGPMVLGVCRRILHREQDAEDAFQGTFVVLAGKADRLCDHPSLPAWLYEVASRIARKATVANARRERRERMASRALPVSDQIDSVSAAEERQILEEELWQLPERYRLPLWLCCWQGLSHSEAAEKLGWTPGALRGRITRGKEKLRQRLTKRGVTAALLATVGISSDAIAVPPPLLHSTSHRVCRQCGIMSDNTLSLEISRLMKGALQTMKTKKCLLIAILLALWIGTGPALLGLQSSLAARRATLPPGKQEPWQDILKLADPEKHTIGKGIWRLRQGKVVAYPPHGGARLRIPVAPKGAYEVRARWQPSHDESAVFFLLPHGNQIASVELHGWLRYSGLGDLNGVRPHINETKKPLKLKAGKIYTITMKLSWSDKQIHVHAGLDGKTFLDWEGKRAEVHHEYYAPPKPYTIALAVENQVSTFHSVEMRPYKREK